jgi:hypothetical protein
MFPAPVSRTFLAGLGLFVVLWTVVWVVLGVWTKHEVRTLRQLSTTVIQSGVAVRQTALQGLRSVPFVGGDVARIGRQVSVAGGNAQRSGRSSRSAVDGLSTLLGVAIAVVPTVPMLVLFAVTWRLSRPRELPA